MLGYAVIGTVDIQHKSGTGGTVRMNDAHLPLTPRQRDIMKHNIEMINNNEDLEGQMVLDDQVDIFKSKPENYLPSSQEIIMAINDGGSGADTIMSAKLTLLEIYQGDIQIEHSTYEFDEKGLRLITKQEKDNFDEESSESEDQGDTTPDGTNKTS